MRQRWFRFHQAWPRAHAILILRLSRHEHGKTSVRLHPFPRDTNSLDKQAPQKKFQIVQQEVGRHFQIHFYGHRVQHGSLLFPPHFDLEWLLNAASSALALLAAAAAGAIHAWAGAQKYTAQIKETTRGRPLWPHGRMVGVGARHFAI